MDGARAGRTAGLARAVLERARRWRERERAASAPVSAAGGAGRGAQPPQLLRSVALPHRALLSVRLMAGGRRGAAQRCVHFRHEFHGPSHAGMREVLQPCAGLQVRRARSETHLQVPRPASGRGRAAVRRRQEKCSFCSVQSS